MYTINHTTSNKINILPSLPLLLILDSQFKIPSKNTLWPLHGYSQSVLHQCWTGQRLAVKGIEQLVHPFDELSCACVSWFFCNMYWTQILIQFNISYSNNIQQTLQLKTMSTCLHMMLFERIHKNVKTVISHNYCGYNHNNKSLDMSILYTS